MAVTSVVVGAVTPSTARVVTQVTSTSDVRVKVSKMPDMSSPVFFGPVTPSGSPNFVASVSLTGLDPDTTYYYLVEHGGVEDTTYPGQFRTHPPLGQPGDFSFLLSSCAGSNPATAGVGSALAPARLSNHVVFQDILARGLMEGSLFFAHLGDLHYYDPGSGTHVPDASVSTYRRAYSDVLLQPRQHELYRKLGWVYTWDDHDYGPNDSDGTHSGKANAAQVYRERVPHYPLAESSGPIYHDFQVGRVHFVVLDGRYNRTPNNATDNASKTMLGSAQKAWLANTLNNSTAAALVVLMGSQWNGRNTDGWAMFTYEREEVIGIINGAGFDSSNTLILFGDSHQSGISSGNNTPGNFPTGMFSSLDSTTTGPHEQSRWDNGQMVGFRGCYGLVKVHDTGESITFTMVGYVEDRAKIWYSFSTGGRTRVSEGNPSHVVAL